MKTNWLARVALSLSLAAAAAAPALAEGRGNFKFSGNNSHMTTRRVMTQNKPMQTQIKTFPSTPIHSGGLKQVTPNFGTIKNLGGSFGTQQRPNLNHLDTIKKVGGVLNQGNGKNGIVNTNLGQKLGDAIAKPQLHVKPDLVHKLGDAVLGKKIDPGFNQKCLPGNNFCKPGCYPWWYLHHWGSHCNYYPCYPHYCPQPIVIPMPVLTTSVVEVVEEQILQVPVGATVTLQGTALGETTGQVIAQMDKIAFPAKVNEWKNNSVNATLPLVGLSSPVRGEIVILRADGSLGHTVKVEFVPAPEPTTPAATLQ